MPECVVLRGQETKGKLLTGEVNWHENDVQKKEREREEKRKREREGKEKERGERGRKDRDKTLSTVRVC